ncbi:MAG: Brp/Blh family beta-carotene 15,15'-dioxygenase [Pseudomonadota bacterium]
MMGQPVVVALLVTTVVFLGLPHGAMDPMVAISSGLVKTIRQMCVFLMLYVLIAALALLLWVVSPWLALTVFLLQSVWHFSEDWTGELPAWQRMVVASLIIIAPAVFHGAETERIFAILVQADAIALILGLQLFGFFALPLFIYTVLGLFRSNSLCALELGGILLLAWLLPPLLFFVVYFCALHSPRHIIEWVERETFNAQQYLFVVLIVTVLTSAAGFAIATGLRFEETPSAAIYVVFVGLAVLTVPHMILIQHVRGEGSASKKGQQSSV